MWIWLIHSKSAVRNITTIQIWRVRRNAKIWVGRIALLLLRSLRSRCSIFLPSPKIPRHYGLRLLPKAQFLLLCISLSLEELVFGIGTSLKILPVNHSLSLLHHCQVDRAIVHKHLSYKPFVFITLNLANLHRLTHWQ